jgi:thymidylate kinase
MHELARRHRAEAVVLADEGTVLSAYYLFVYNEATHSEAELERFARLVPLPDLIVYVKAPLGVLVDRAISRADRRRELASLSRSQVEHWIGRAVEVFDFLATTEPIAGRLLVVDNGDSAPADRIRLVRQVTAFVTDSGATERALPPPGFAGSAP